MTATAFTRLQTGVLIVTAAAGLSACGGGSGGGGNDGASNRTSYNASNLLANTADNVIYGIYDNMAEQATEMEAAVQALANDPTTAEVEAARDEWVDTRVFWERSEAFLFGPVSGQGLDPRLDSWPLDVNAMENFIAQGNITQDTIDNADNNVRGFHTAEFLLWSDSNTANDIDDPQIGQDTAANVAAKLATSQARRDYLLQVVIDIRQTAEQLAGLWIPSGDNFGDALKTAGADGNTTFPSQSSAVEQVIIGMRVIANEVGSGKIGGPFSLGDPTQVESKHSFNSRKDFMNNIRGIKHVYLGDFPFQSDGGADGVGVTDYVQALGAATVDQAFKTQIDFAIAQIEAIDQPFRVSITGSAAQKQEIQNAIEGVLALRNMIDNDILPLLEQTDFAP